jgi:hypothetical protein
MLAQGSQACNLFYAGEAVDQVILRVVYEAGVVDC